MDTNQFSCNASIGLKRNRSVCWVSTLWPATQGELETPQLNMHTRMGGGLRWSRVGDCAALGVE